MHYDRTDITTDETPHSSLAAFQHAIDIYASETNKTASVWRLFSEFLRREEPAAAQIVPSEETPGAFADRMVQLARPRLDWLAGLSEEEWLRQMPFFDVQRERIWIFWRRVLHTAHHRTQLTVYARLLNKPVPSTYGPTADVTWSGADPTVTAEAAERSG
jgi:uncharacterized damage-inducible protein DinB